MKPFIEKLPVDEQGSFVARRFTTPAFEVPWHQHAEYELILFHEGEGSSFIGDYIGEFKTGDVFFLGANLPHTFQKSAKDMITTALVIQFTENFWGELFLQLPECSNIRRLFTSSLRGLRLQGSTREKVARIMNELEKQTGFKKLILLCQCLEIIASTNDHLQLSSQEAVSFNARNQERIDNVFRYTINNFQQTVTLEEVAATAGMSIPAFCNYFRKTTKKTYIDFLHEVRIGYACQQLIDSQKPVQEICFESGFNTLANFNKQFLKLKHISPSAYRKNFRHSLTA